MLNKTPFPRGAKSPRLSLELLRGHRGRQMLPCRAGSPAQRVEAGRLSAVCRLEQPGLLPHAARAPQGCESSPPRPGRLPCSGENVETACSLGHETHPDPFRKRGFCGQWQWPLGAGRSPGQGPSPLPQFTTSPGLLLGQQLLQYPDPKFRVFHIRPSTSSPHRISPVGNRVQCVEAASSGNMEVTDRPHRPEITWSFPRGPQSTGKYTFGC